MEIKQNSQKLSETLRLFTKICNVNIDFVDKNINYFNNLGRKNPYCEKIAATIPNGSCLCRCSDECLFEKCRQSGKMQIHTCYAGLTDIAIPIFLSGELIGYIVLGQIKTDPDFENARKKLERIGANVDNLKEYYDALPLFSYEQINDIATLSTIFSKYILSENIFKLEHNDITNDACEYIRNHLKSELSIEEIARNIGASKSSIYKYFKLQFGKTPGEYINKIRAETSADMLLNSNKSIDEISENVGFSSASYYSKIFKKHFGVPPLKYRKGQR